MSVLAIVNSVCLKRIRREDAKWLFDELKRRFNADIRTTKYSDNASEIAARLEGFDTIISVGGDGTLFEIINRANITGHRFGIVPIGTGNSLALDLSITSPEKALTAITDGSIKSIDLIKVEFETARSKSSKYMTATAGIGFFADIAAASNKRIKALGKFCYPVVTFIHSFNKDSKRYEVSINNSADSMLSLSTILINNTSRIGHLKVFKEADLFDGKLNIWLNNGGLIGQMLWNLGIITGTFFYDSASRYVVDRLSFKSKEPSRLMIDGETFNDVLSVQFQIAEERLAVFC